MLCEEPVRMLREEPVRMPREDSHSSMPLLEESVDGLEVVSPMKAPLGSASEQQATSRGASLDDEQARAVSEARLLLEAQLSTLKRRKQASRAETSELLRDTCQNLSELATRLQQVWQRAHPGEKPPAWAVEAIPEEEFGRIGWDFHANRVQHRSSEGSLWEAITVLLKGDQSGGFVKPPSAPEVTEAMTRACSRLSGSTPVACC
mmetsp:Transcript_39900/g.107801  ORF Transcript_39900/g.107801 Transcript_39900/m.107801 type:complete len:205 (-) Transcript_39900:61-675(-)|eukprot:CAMPEP_0171292286 /NCGR_PEP_ID=MMETSP0790-20130122/72081_1 /TAXON_ID=2925 /ORGANISM="Alexandrium catenella, Strain OF101" /LENGTH=204 /DNA_ID=CAMNT_0011762019 /DNA_START=39 /DNA_END=653 /DNA_ORIENTATION=-